MPAVTVDVVSDVVCPWCFVGQRRLGRALGQVGADIDVDVRWRPFQLDPTIPPGGLDRREYMLAKFGSAERLAAAHERLNELGAREGIDFHFERISRSPNTIDAHRLIRWASAHGTPAQNDLAAELFSRYFEQGQDIGDANVLADAAIAAGLPDENWRARLLSDEDRETVREEAVNFSRMGVTGVPCFILAGRYAVSGAQEAEALAQAIDQVARMGAEAAE
ncbi:MAG TPA: DsbA family oxidoreductase [Mesorhizobium sp.]|jgi:predicted DsbA family dithiol-disulfide isomerase|nr:DsbA family oxidoreductase [Mesorhizobium sp.]